MVQTDAKPYRSDLLKTTNTNTIQYIFKIDIIGCILRFTWIYNEDRNQKHCYGCAIPVCSKNSLGQKGNGKFYSMTIRSRSVFSRIDSICKYYIRKKRKSERRVGDNQFPLDQTCLGVNNANQIKLEWYRTHTMSIGHRVTIRIV